ncbi:hypothetical protein L1887_52041 [Cichorium endivia]|nr:hypothetical protein L1887_52041 [Cichorium endivia]
MAALAELAACASACGISALGLAGSDCTSAALAPRKPRHLAAVATQSAKLSRTFHTGLDHPQCAHERESDVGKTRESVWDARLGMAGAIQRACVYVVWAGTIEYQEGKERLSEAMK